MVDTLSKLAEVLEERKQADPDSSYVARLYSKGLDAILKKIGEEATETVMAAKEGVPEKIIYETADLWFHCMVLLAQQGLYSRMWKLQQQEEEQQVLEQTMLEIVNASS